MSRVLHDKFFEGPPLAVARGLLGKFLIKKGKAYMITEVEAYGGPEDLASHARFTSRRRNQIMFGPAGVWYVYFTYGMHWLANIITGPEGKPGAVLIRGIEGISGPARITKALGIGGKLNGKAVSPAYGVWIEDRGVKIPASKIKKSARVGVSYAGPVWAKKEWRLFIFAGDIFRNSNFAKNKEKSRKNYGGSRRKFKKAKPR